MQERSCSFPLVMKHSSSSLSNLRLFFFQLVRETTRQDNVPIQNGAVRRQPPQVCAHFAAADRPFAFVVGRGAAVATLGGGDEQDAVGLGLAHKCKLVRVLGPKIIESNISN